MDTSANNAPRTFSDLSVDKLKIMFADRISPRRLACAENKYELLKYLWKECQIEDCYLDKYKVNNRDDIGTRDDAFSRYLLGTTSGSHTGHNEYARQRLADRIEPMPQAVNGASLVNQFEDKKLKIIDLIRSDIGSKYWDFGRCLRVKQGLLDAIDKEQTAVARKVDKIFEAFEKECCNEVTYVNRIRTALIDVRRKDLALKVNKIMEH